MGRQGAQRFPFHAGPSDAGAERQRSRPQPASGRAVSDHAVFAAFRERVPPEPSRSYRIHAPTSSQFGRVCPAAGSPPRRRGPESRLLARPPCCAAGTQLAAATARAARDQPLGYFVCAPLLSATAAGPRGGPRGGFGGASGRTIPGSAARAADCSVRGSARRQHARLDLGHASRQRGVRPARSRTRTGRRSPGTA